MFNKTQKTKFGYDIVPIITSDDLKTRFEGIVDEIRQIMPVDNHFCCWIWTRLCQTAQRIAVYRPIGTGTESVNS